MPFAPSHPLRLAFGALKLRALLGLALVAVWVGHAAGLWSLSWVEPLDRQLYDVQVRASASASPSAHPEVVIVDIDERSLAALGRWPWPRERLAQLTDTLFEHYRVRSVSFDIVFAEPDPAGDTAFARALRERPVVLGHYLTSDRQGQRHGQLPPPVIVLGPDSPRIAATRWNGYGANLPELAQAAPRAGFFNAITDPDGVVRALPMLAELDGAYHESLALATYRVARQVPAVVPLWRHSPSDSERTLAGLTLPLPDGRSQRIDIDPRAAAWVPYRGPGGPQAGSFAYLSVADVLQRRIAPEALAQRVVLVGTTAPGLLDLHRTPLGQAYPGVEVHASLIAALLDARPLPTPAPGATEALQLLLLGPVLALLFPLMGVLGSLALALGAALALAALHIGAWQLAAVVWPLASALTLVAALWVLNTGLGHLFENWQRRRLASLFGRYVPRDLVRQMYRDPARYDMRARPRHLTVMFCDIRGFTGMAETLPSGTLQPWLNQVFARLAERIAQHSGTIDKYMGDSVMAFWGAPLPDPQHAHQAVRAALALDAEARQLSGEQHSQGLPGVGLGIGLSTGDMMVGDVGSELRSSYTVIGDAVNLGARLQALGQRYGVAIVASQATRDAAPGFVWLELDRVRVRGRAQAETIHTPVCATGDASPSDLDRARRWCDCLELWRQRRWDAATAALQALSADHGPHPLHQLYAQRVQALRAHPPPDPWDGVCEPDPP